ncbi:MAG: helicase-related protein [candidate division WOR-3 bacterium]
MTGSGSGREKAQLPQESACNYIPADCLREGVIITGTMFNEPMRVVGTPRKGNGFVIVDLVGTRSQTFKPGILLNNAELAGLTVTVPETKFTGDASLFKLGLEALRIRLAHEYDPYFGLSVCKVDPLPHQLDAIYNHLLKAWRCRFLLADDAGAGKTIMAGLLLKELKLRGLVERTLVICPANLAFQWRREMKDKFDEHFEQVTGARLREAYAVNVWDNHSQVITSMDLAKLDHVLPSLQQAEDWDLVIVDEAHRMSARDSEHKSERYRLGEILRDKTVHYLLLTGTPHKGDPDNFCLFLQLLDQEAYADVTSIQEAMKRREAPFYLRRTKEAMLSFPELQADGKWRSRKLFTRRIPSTVAFDLVGNELDLYKDVTRYVQTQSQRASERGDDLWARAVGFLMAMYQRRMASSTYALKESLKRRHKKLKEELESGKPLTEVPAPEIPEPESWDEMEDSERERVEHEVEGVTLAQRRDDLRKELEELDKLIAAAEQVESSGQQAKLQALRAQLTEQGILSDQSRRLLLFTEYKDTLDFLVRTLRSWGLTVGFIHGGMKPGSRDEPGTRLYAERQFWDLATQVLVATEAAGEGINLHCCNVLFNYDIPWNPNRLEQRMGRIHRYGQKLDCYIFNFFARNTVEGRVLAKLLDKLDEIRRGLEEDTVFDVVGQVLPPNQIEHLLREFYAGRMSEDDIHARLDVEVNKADFEKVCRSALEGLARSSLNLPMLVEQRALARERRIVPEAIARFFRDAAARLYVELKPLRETVYKVGRIPPSLFDVTRGDGWHYPALAKSYGVISFDRKTAEDDPKVEWVTPGHPLFEAVRRSLDELAAPELAKGCVLYDIDRESESLLEVFKASVVDATGKTLHQRLFVVETTAAGERILRELSYLLGLISPSTAPAVEPKAAEDLTGSQSYLVQSALPQFLAEVKEERLKDLLVVERHVKLCFEELIRKRNEVLSRHLLAKDRGDAAAEGLAEIESQKLIDLQRRRDRRYAELARQRELSLQGIERIAVALVLPHPERNRDDVTRLRPDPEVERKAMEAVIAYETARGCKVEDVHKQNLGYDLRSIHADTGELRLIEVKGLGAAKGRVLLTPNERRVAEDRRDCFWLYVVTACDTKPFVQPPIQDPAQFRWHEVSKVEHYWLELDVLTGTVQVKDA